MQQYIVFTVIEGEKSTGYYVINSDSKAVQSCWRTYKEAKEAQRMLNLMVKKGKAA